ncbi:MAG: hypothetical protein AB4426_10325 [Xenococcaceae cyanobacterium]
MVADWLTRERSQNGTLNKRQSLNVNLYFANSIRASTQPTRRCAPRSAPAGSRCVAGMRCGAGA